MAIIDQGGGIEALRFAFYKNEDLENDGIWDIWHIEGPNVVIHFRGVPNAAPMFISAIRHEQRFAGYAGRILTSRPEAVVAWWQNKRQQCQDR